jgi:hypothetical protein
MSGTIRQSHVLPQAFADSDFCHSEHSEATKTAAKPVLTWNGISTAFL